MASVFSILPVLVLSHSALYVPTEIANNEGWHRLLWLCQSGRSDQWQHDENIPGHVAMFSVIIEIEQAEAPSLPHQGP